MLSRDETQGRVLVVDDMGNWHDTLALIFEQEGCSVECVHNISEAEEAVAQQSFDLIMLDIRLSDEHPRNEGIQFLRHIRSLGDESEVVIFTAYPDVQTVRQALKDLGARDYLIKSPEGGFDEIALKRFREVTQEAIAVSRARNAVSDSDYGAILLVEDDDNWVDILSEALLGEGHAVDSAQDLKQAEERIRASTQPGRTQYRLAIVDLQLEPDVSPDRQGAALLNMLTRRSPETDVIVVSAFPSARGVRDAFREYRVRDFLTKNDFNVPSFLNTVRESFEEVSQRFLVAWFEGRTRDASLHVGQEYSLGVTCQRYRSPGYDCVRFWLPSSPESSRLHIVLHAQDMDIQPSISQFLDLDPLAQRAQPLRFLVTPNELGKKRVTIDAYRSGRLSAMLRRSLDVIAS